MVFRSSSCAVVTQEEITVCFFVMITFVYNVKAFFIESS